MANFLGCMMCAFLVLVLFVPSYFIVLATLPTRRITTTTSEGMSQPSSHSEIASLCHRYAFVPYWFGILPHNRKVYDLFLISDDLDWLEIRLNTLAPHVDYFVIVESNKTFTGQPKLLHLKANWSRFSKFHDKIIHHVAEDPEARLGTSSWAHEEVFGNALLYSTFPTLLFTDREAKEGDILLVSNVDEIPKPDTLTVLRYCYVPDRVTLHSQSYQNSFQWLHIGEQWAHPQATVFHGLSRTISPADLRHGVGGPKTRFAWWSRMVRGNQKVDLLDAAWHCKSCSNESVREDLTGSEGDSYTRVENNTDVPQYVLDDQRRFGYMLD